jgi:hypothetical protein
LVGVGALNKVRRFEVDPETGEHRQLTNAYALVPSSQWWAPWRERLRRWRTSTAPPPDPESTGAHPPLPCVLTAAKEASDRGEPATAIEAILASDPTDHFAKLMLDVHATAAKRAFTRDN